MPKKTKEAIRTIAITMILVLLTLIPFFYWLDNSKPVYVEKEIIKPVVIEKEVLKIIEKEMPVYIEAEADRWEMFEITGYSLDDPSQGTNSTVAIGLDLDPYSFPVIAVDPKIIPLYSIVKIKDLGSYIAIDTGGLIKGNKIDVLFESKQLAKEFGVQDRLVKVERIK